MATQPSVAAATKRLQDLGYRLTPQRMMILEEVMDSEEHVTAEDLYEQVRKRYSHISFFTVYRTLEVLRDSGFITQTDLGGGRWQYHPVDKATHHHLVCQGCGSVAEVDQSVLSDLQRELDEQYGFDAILTHFAIFGRCRNCR